MRSKRLPDIKSNLPIVANQLPSTLFGRVVNSLVRFANNLTINVTGGATGTASITDSDTIELSISIAPSGAGLYYLESDGTTGIVISNIPGVALSRVPSTAAGQFRVTHNLGQCVPMTCAGITAATTDMFSDVLANTTTYTDIVTHNPSAEVDSKFYLYLTKV